MAQAALVEMQIKKGQTLLERLRHEGITVTAAGWVKSENWVQVGKRGDAWYDKVVIRFDEAALKALGVVS